MTPMPVEAPDELALVAWRGSGDFSISQIGSSDYSDEGSGLSCRSNFSYPIYRALRGGAPNDVGLFAFAFLRGGERSDGRSTCFRSLSMGGFFPQTDITLPLATQARPSHEQCAHI